MQHLKNEVSKILDAFTRQELGNRLSEFAMISLKAMITKEIDNHADKTKECPSTEES